MRYIRVELENIGGAYQEISGGSVTRYLSLDGDELFISPPIGRSCRVVEAEPEHRPWMDAEASFRVLTPQEIEAALKQASVDSVVAEVKVRELDQKALDELTTLVEAKKV